MTDKYDASEQDEIIEEFTKMLRVVTGDGGKKRNAGLKPSWKVDPSHEAAIFSHLMKWKKQELVDPDSGQHPLVHAAWRCLAIAWREMHPEPEVIEPAPKCVHPECDRSPHSLRSPHATFYGVGKTIKCE